MKGTLPTDDLKCSTSNITAKLKETLENKLKLINWSNNIVAVCFDTAAFMLGCLNSVTANLARDAKHLVVIHCCTHKLELAIKDTIKSVDEISNVEELLMKPIDTTNIAEPTG